MNVKKTSTNGFLPVTILKQCVGVYLPFLTKAINNAITDNTFPEQLKKSEVIPLHKKEDPLKKENYRPMSLLPHVSKVFEKIIYKQIKTYNWISKITWNATFFNDHARKMEKFFWRKGKIFAFYLWISQRPLTQ